MRNSLFYNDALCACLAYAGKDFSPSLENSYSKLAHIQKRLFDHLMDSQKPYLKLKVKTYHTFPATYQNGWYSCHYASAYVTRMGKFITVAFCGTDEVKEVLDYLNLKKHYAFFSPLVEAVVDYAKKHNLFIRATGHSLGGAMVEYFIEQVAPLYSSIHGTTFGSPGSSASPLESKITNFYHLDDVVPYIGNIRYKKHGKTILIKKNAFHMLGSHFAEEYVNSIDEIPTENIITSLDYQKISVDSRLFYDYKSEKVHSVHLYYNFFPLFFRTVIKKIRLFRA